MYKNYAIVVQSANSKKVHLDIFYAKSESDARHCFNECYRHGSHRILSITEIPD